MKLLTLMVLSLWSNSAFSEEPGRFTFLGLNECAPFEGVLFDPDATATILSNRAFVSSSCEVKIKYALDTQSAEYALELQNLQIRHDALTNEYDMRIQSMERETTALAEALRKQSKKNPVLWVVAGIAGGIAMSYTAYRVLDE
tara:strand:+ start:50 stop:478 length:429 start_codon:yes stop_codon:yes gene_type:complete